MEEALLALPSRSDLRSDLYPICNLAVLSWTAEPLCHCVTLLELQLETPSFTCDCSFLHVITPFTAVQKPPNTQVTLTPPVPEHQILSYL